MRHLRPLSGRLLSATGGAVVRTPIPPLARFVRIRASKLCYWRLDGTDPTTSSGLRAESGVSQIKVGGREEIRFIAAGSYQIYVQFFGGDSSSPTDVRAKGPHTNTAVGASAVTITDHTDKNSAGMLARANATEILCRGNNPWAYTIDGSTPTATHGIQVPTGTYVTVPIRQGTLRVIRRGTNNVTLVSQAYEDHHILTHDPLIPVHTVAGVTGHFSATLGTNVQRVDVPKHATYARINAVAQAVQYSLNEVNPTGQGSLLVAAGTSVDTPVTPGGTVRLLRAANGAIANIAFFSE